MKKIFFILHLCLFNVFAMEENFNNSRSGEDKIIGCDFSAHYISAQEIKKKLQSRKIKLGSVQITVYDDINLFLKGKKNDVERLKNLIITSIDVDNMKNNEQV